VTAIDWVVADGLVAKRQALFMTNFVLGWMAVAALRLVP
jgi:hypothetical protein